MQEVKYSGEVTNSEYDSEEELLEGVKLSLQNPEVKTISIKRLTGKQKRQQRREQHSKAKQ